MNSDKRQHRHLEHCAHTNRHLLCLTTEAVVVICIIAVLLQRLSLPPRKAGRLAMGGRPGAVAFTTTFWVGIPGPFTLPPQRHTNNTSHSLFHHNQPNSAFLAPEAERERRVERARDIRPCRHSHISLSSANTLRLISSMRSNPFFPLIASSWKRVMSVFSTR